MQCGWRTSTCGCSCCRSWAGASMCCRWEWQCDSSATVAVCSGREKGGNGSGTLDGAPKALPQSRPPHLHFPIVCCFPASTGQAQWLRCHLPPACDQAGAGGAGWALDQRRCGVQLVRQSCKGDEVLSCPCQTAVAACRRTTACWRMALGGRSTTPSCLAAARA